MNYDLYNKNKKIINKNKNKKIINKNKNKKIIDKIQNNSVRQLEKYIHKIINLKKIKGCIYYYLHIFFIFLVLFITLFTTSIIQLSIMLLIISLDAISVIYLHECPLTMMERKYLGYTSCDERNEKLKNMNIMYNCNHTYEKQLELLINSWCIIAIKCSLIIFFSIFKIQLIDASNIYS
jgi:hypothetical protein